MNRGGIKNNDRDYLETPGLTAASGRKIILIRHGRTEWNELFRYQGATDVPLSAKGEEQARMAGLRLSGVSVDKIISSPLGRSLKTAEIISDAAGIKRPEVWDELKEVDFGEWEGLTVHEIRSRFSDDTFDRWKNAQLDVTAPGGEDAGDMYARASRAAERLISASSGNLIVVGHGAIFRALLVPLLNVPKSNIFWKMRMDNCSMTVVDIDKKGVSSIVVFNDTAHLHVNAENMEYLPVLW